ncbi:RNA12 protein-domain-containing protein [Helicostylum pulchrum]|uniref:Mitochondrial escape protein 2 n=1 Tax=Helicostylum pulchrum TaxID=562976 RepID=A0ABP9XPJ3_9FUNG|nr:RNA12 protein-domain-containing protein [Helicostylum pulchrum]
MLLSRLGVNTTIRREFLKRTSVSLLPRACNITKIRTFKSTVKLYEEELTQAVKKVTTEIPVAQIAREQNAQLYLNNVFPLKMNSLDIRSYFFRNSKQFLEKKAHEAIPSNDLPFDFAIKEIIARTKDGGAVVTFSFKSTDSSKSQVARDIVERVNDYIVKQNIVAKYNFRTVRAFLVKGAPFMEDLIARYPTQRLRIEFQGEPVSVERLYRHLRPYGRIFDISIYPNPHVSKDPARYAIAQFTRVRYATSARNCLHGYTINDTRLNILYERQLRTNVVKEWLVNHPRITVPVFAATLAGVTYIVFDPIRVFFITSKATQRFNPQEYALYRWLRSETWAKLMPTGTGSHVEGSSIWAHDEEKTEKLKSWLAERPETFVLVTGHKGSGKSALVKSAIKDRKNKVFIDCEELANSRNKSDMTKSLAKEVGYFPVFTWAASMSGLVDTAIAATTGQKAGFSSSPDSQMKSILETVAIALRDVVPTDKERRRQTEEDEGDETLLRRLKTLIYGRKQTISEKGTVEEDIDKLDEKSIPIVVIDNYMCRETAKNAVLWEELAEWASILIENGIAHVVFVTSNASVMKTLGKALPGKSFSNIALSDAPPEMAMSYINKQLGNEVDDPELPDVVAALGGRLTELELLVQKMKMKMDAQTAFEDIVTRNLIEIRKYGFGDSWDEDKKMEWSSIQFWTIVKLLTNNMCINYDELKWSPAFLGAEAPLKAMERAELITIIQKEGRPDSIRPGKPVFYTVFNRLVSDTVFAASMEVECNMALKKQSETEMTKLENNIEKLTNINATNKPPKEVQVRIQYLLTKLASIQNLIENYDKKIKDAKEVISTAWIEEKNNE